MRSGVIRLACWPHKPEITGQGRTPQFMFPNKPIHVITGKSKPFIKAITAPEPLLVPTRNVDTISSLFVAGGISNCPDWQSTFAEKIQENYPKNLLVYNPRRNVFDVSNPTAAAAQIKWEYVALHYSKMVAFWFPKETLCPITLFELGSILYRSKKVFVGCHPDYARKMDIVEQLKNYSDYTENEIPIVDSIDGLIKEICTYAGT